MEWKGHNIYFTYPYADITEATPTQKNVTFTFQMDNKGHSYLFFTSEVNVTTVLRVPIVVTGTCYS